MTRELKSKVTTLANRLAKAMPRRAAFVQAWQIIRAGTATFPVRGVMVGNRQTALRRLARYNPVSIRAFIVPEENNPVDKDALAVMVGVNNGKGYYKLGYIPASETAKAAALLSGKVPAIRVVYGTWGRCGETYGARLTLAV
jgi:hypothetical protein